MGGGLAVLARACVGRNVGVEGCGPFPPCRHPHISAFMELLSLAIHHHHRTFHYSHHGCVVTLIDFGGILWTQAPALPHGVLIGMCPSLPSGLPGLGCLGVVLST